MVANMSLAFGLKKPFGPCAGEKWWSGRNSFFPLSLWHLWHCAIKNKSPADSIVPVAFFFLSFIFLIIIRRRLITESSLSRLMEDRTASAVQHLI
jgi:hypothetical protein